LNKILGKDFLISMNQSSPRDFVSSTMAAPSILSVVFIKIVKMDSCFQIRLNLFQRAKTLGK
jgi:hypothetical protein